MLLGSHWVTMDASALLSMARQFLVWCFYPLSRVGLAAKVGCSIVVFVASLRALVVARRTNVGRTN